jgi:hypothetical protein
MISEHSDRQLAIDRLSTEQKLSLMFARCELDELKLAEHGTPVQWARICILAGLGMTAMIWALGTSIPFVSAAVCGLGSSAIITSIACFWEASERRRIRVLSGFLERFD